MRASECRKYTQKALDTNFWFKCRGDGRNTNSNRLRCTLAQERLKNYVDGSLDGAGLRRIETDRQKERKSDRVCA